ncbi:MULTISPECIES: hypothetical protein [Acidaminococcus]|jgi:hypothetical protein|uniref:hypothetical protein n=1 Tax=Acidaminococcus TaxID=904 RepID=UPI0022E7C76C|nr:hypothetical protein [Acidaminococcus massiliensis]
MGLNKKIAKAIVAGLVVASSFGTVVPAMAAPAVKDTIASKQAAIDAAAKVVPPEAVLTSAKTDDAKFDLEYLVPDTLQRYEIVVDRSTSKVQSAVIKTSNYPGSVTVSKTEADVKGTILADYPDAKNIVVTKYTDDKSGTPFVIYKATFETATLTGTALLNPATALIGYQELKFK